MSEITILSDEEIDAVSGAWGKIYIGNIVLAKNVTGGAGYGGTGGAGGAGGKGIFGKGGAGGDGGTGGPGFGGSGVGTTNNAVVYS